MHTPSPIIGGEMLQGANVFEWIGAVEAYDMREGMLRMCALRSNAV